MKDIKDYEKLYAVTSCGKVWSYKTGKFLKPHLDKDGYLQITLFKESKPKTIRIHRIVAETYILKPVNFKEINHKNECKTDNNINNLEWCNRFYNNVYGTRLQKMSKPIICIDNGKIFKSIIYAQRKLNIDGSSITKCCKGKRKTAGGYHWQYIK